MAQFITQFDFSVLYWIQENMRNPFLDGVCAFLSYAFEAGIFWIITAVVLFAFRRTRVAGVALFVSVFVAFMAGEVVLKNIICRERPCVIDPSVTLAIPAPSAYSCPSGHTGSSFAAAGGIFAYNKKLGVPALVLALIVGLSRMYLFVHFPTDVLFGIAVGLLSSLAVYLVFHKFGIDRRLQGLGRQKV